MADEVRGLPQQCLHNSGQDAGPPACTHHHPQLPVQIHHGGGHGAQGLLAWDNEVGWGWRVAIGVDLACNHMPQWVHSLLDWHVDLKIFTHKDKSLTSNI